MPRDIEKKANGQKHSSNSGQTSNPWLTLSLTARVKEVSAEGESAYELMPER